MILASRITLICQLLNLTPALTNLIFMFNFANKKKNFCFINHMLKHIHNPS